MEYKEFVGTIYIALYATVPMHLPPQWYKSQTDERIEDNQSSPVSDEVGQQSQDAYTSRIENTRKHCNKASL